MLPLLADISRRWQLNVVFSPALHMLCIEIALQGAEVAGVDAIIELLHISCEAAPNTVCKFANSCISGKVRSGITLDA